MAKASRIKRERRTRNDSPAKRSTPDEDGAEVTGRSIWSGSLGFGLLQIPVSLHPAVKANTVAFHQLDRRDQAPIRYKRVNEETGDEVDWKDIVKGYEVEKGRFVIVDDDDFARVAVRSNQQIDVKDFVPAAEILPVYFDTPYMLSPSGRTTKAYGLFREALRRQGLAAIGTFVLRTREHICAVFPVGDALVLDIMRFEDELRDPKRLKTRTSRGGSSDKTFSARELEMAEQLIDNMRSEWDPSRYHDTYKDALVKLLEKKAKTGTLPPAPRVKAPRADVVDLMALLKKSIAEKGPKERGKTRHRKRAA